MANSDYKPLASFLHVLEVRSYKKQTGRFFITTPENHAGYLDIDQGVISAAKYRIKKGMDAIEHICAAHWLKFRFDHDSDVSHDKPELLHTSIILHMIENALEERAELPELIEKTATLS